MIQPTNAQQIYPQPTGGANAVSINIFNPQAYGGVPQGANNNVSAPYSYQNPIYAMPQASLYQPQAAMPAQYPIYQPIQQAVIPEQAPAQQPIAPAPQMMPNSVIDSNAQAPDANQAQQVQTAAQEVQQPEVAEVQNNNNAQVINIDELTKGLQSTDNDTKAKTINQIAEYVQSTPETALQVVSEPIMKSLVNIINEDTSALEGPTDQQIAIAEKIAKGEQLTPEENALSEQLSPRDKANKNRIFALYTLAMIQKLQRDELNQYIETQKANGEQPIEPLPIDQLIGYNDIVNVINNDPRPEVKVAAIQALQYVAEPQDKASIEAVLKDSLNSQDEAVKSAATETMAKFAA